MIKQVCPNLFVYKHTIFMDFLEAMLAETNIPLSNQNKQM